MAGVCHYTKEASTANGTMKKKGPAFVRPGWSRDEIVLLVRAEIHLVWEARKRGQEEGRVRVNADLCRRFPSKKRDSIVNVRNTKNYRDLRSRLEGTMIEETMGHPRASK